MAPAPHCIRLAGVWESLPFIEAIKTKILLEVAGLTPSETLIKRIQDTPRSNCLSGEMQWRDRWNN